MFSLCVYCGSRSGDDPRYAEAARALGTALGEGGHRLVYGGGHAGLMGAVADATLAAGGQVLGVIPRRLVARELGHRGIQELRVVDTMHERKQMMADLSDGFIAMPGGFGTFEEFCETLTWAQLGLHNKPCGMLNVNGYYDAMLAMFDHAVREQFVTVRHRQMIMAQAEPSALLDAMAAYQGPPTEKWLMRDET